MTLPVDSCSLPSSQNKGGLGLRMKKKGRSGKKKPNRIPWRIEELEEDD